MNFEAVAELVAGVGFPAAIATVMLYWLLRRLNGSLDSLLKAVTQLSIEIRALRQDILAIFAGRLNEARDEAERTLP